MMSVMTLRMPMFVRFVAMAIIPGRRSRRKTTKLTDNQERGEHRAQFHSSVLQNGVCLMPSLYANGAPKGRDDVRRSRIGTIGVWMLPFVTAARQVIVESRQHSSSGLPIYEGHKLTPGPHLMSVLIGDTFRDLVHVVHIVSHPRGQ